MAGSSEALDDAAAVDPEPGAEGDTEEPLLSTELGAALVAGTVVEAAAGLDESELELSELHAAAADTIAALVIPSTIRVVRVNVIAAPR